MSGENILPISHWSYSSMMLFLKNRLQFKKQYILNIFDYKTSPAALVGQACHAAVAEFWKNQKLSMDKITEAGLKIINHTVDDKIDWGKTGSREDIIKDFMSALNFYFQELPVYGEVLGVEKSITQFINVDGQEMAIPAKVKTDLIARDNSGKIVIIDHKFVSRYTDPDKDKPEFVLQSMFNKYNVEAEFGEKVERMIYNEVKISKNKDGTPQSQPYEIIFDKHPDYDQFFKQIYIDCTTEISKPDCSYLPNIGDMMSGPESFDEYRKKIITVDAPIGISHRTRKADFVDKKYIASSTDIVDNKYLTNEEKIRTKLLEFGLAVEMKDTFVGPNITLYTFKPSRANKMSSFDGYAKDLAIALKAKTIRVEAPIMGTDTIGVEIPNEERQIVQWNEKYLTPDTLKIPIGINVHNEVVSKDLADMPHLLVAGATGSGKSVMLNVIIRTLFQQNDFARLKLVLIDPKRVELSQFKGLPHLLTPVIYDDAKAIKTIEWLVAEMEQRYDKLEKQGCRSIDEYNRNTYEIMPKIVVVVDEFGDLIQSTVSDTFGNNIVRLAQKSRAVGIHLVLGTQRPSVDVLPGILKANLPTRIAFMTSSKVDSQVILDQTGAEELTGRGDLLFLDPHQKNLQRLQGLLI